MRDVSFRNNLNCARASGGEQVTHNVDERAVL